MLLLLPFCKTLVTASILVSMHSERAEIVNAGVFTLVSEAQSIMKGLTI